MELVDRLRKALEESGLSVSDCAKRADINYNRMRNLHDGKIKKLTRDEALALESATGFRSMWLMDGKGAQRLTQEEQRLQPNLERLRNSADLARRFSLQADDARWLSELTYYIDADSREDVTRVLAQRATQRPDASFVMVPRYSVRAAAGDGAVISDESIVDYLAFRRDWLVNRRRCDPNRVALIEAAGDSMSGTFEDGDLLLVDLREQMRKDDGIYVLRMDETVRVKRVAWRAGGAMEIISDNPSYGRQMLDVTDAQKVSLIGRVRWYGREV
jgi:phage repressor protein C with HTH and peptisase S24 domain